MRAHSHSRPADSGRAALRDAADRISARVGDEYFHALSKHLARATEADCVAICEFSGPNLERFKTVAAVASGRKVSFEFALAGSAASTAARGRSYECRSGARLRRPRDPMLARLHGEAYVGVPLLDQHHLPIGVLLAVYRHARSDLAAPKELLKAFAPRASAELVRKLEEDGLRESEQRYQAFIADSPTAMWRIDLREPVPTDLPEAEQLELLRNYGYLTEFNKSFLSLLGAGSPEDVAGCEVGRLLPYLSQPGPIEATYQLIRSGYRPTISEVDVVNPSGQRRRHVRTAWGIVEDGKLLRIWGTTQDVTEARQSWIALQAAEQRIARMLEVAQVAVVMLDSRGSITYMNRYLADLTGKGEKDLVGRNWIDALVPAEEQDKVRAVFQAVTSQEDERSRIETGVVGRDGERRQIAWDGAVLRGVPGGNEEAVLIGRDVTEQRTLEEQVRQAQKLDAIGRLAGGIAHDFNNLLTVIEGYAALLLDQQNIPVPARDAIDEVRKAAETGSHLTRQLLAFSRRQPLQPQVLNPNLSIREAETMLSRLLSPDVDLTTQLDSEAGSVRADKGQIQQVLLNLVVNARDAMPKGGSIIIRSENRMVSGPHDLSAPGVPPGEYVVISVADTGTGMSLEVRSHIFEPFFTTKEAGKGTGMGLSVVYGIVRQNAGYIVVDSAPSVGSCFRVYLPRAESIEPSAEAAGETPSSLAGSETILLVESHREVRTVAARTLRGLGYTVLEAADPRDAMEIAERRPDVRLLISDVILPGMSGASLARVLLETRPRLKTLVLSGSMDSDGPDVSVGAGLPVLRKPFTPAALARKIRDVLRPD
jgi:two-component system, cell cycle sensor histidine kinase and response regulator CckA